MKRWISGVIGLALITAISGAVWAGEDEGAGESKKKQEKQQEQKHERVRDGEGSHMRGGPGRIGEADKDKDGKVSLEEFTEAHMERVKAIFERLDVNKDGFLDETDREAMRAKREGEEGKEGDKGKRGLGGDKERKRMKDRERDHDTDAGDAGGEAESDEG